MHLVRSALTGLFMLTWLAMIISLMLAIYFRFRWVGFVPLQILKPEPKDPAYEDRAKAWLVRFISCWLALVMIWLITSTV